MNNQFVPCCYDPEGRLRLHANEPVSYDKRKDEQRCVTIRNDQQRSEIVRARPPGRLRRERAEADEEGC